MIRSNTIVECFSEAIESYNNSHQLNPYPVNSLKHILFEKSIIDNNQWHLEDLIRVDNIDPVEGLALKRQIDKSNQQRTNIVEKIDEILYDYYSDVVVKLKATFNTETPAWVIDRLSILLIKIYHSTKNGDNERLKTLLEQKNDLCQSFDELMFDISVGEKKYKLYRQLKMYKIPE